MVVIMKREFTPEQLEAAVHTMEEGGVKVMVSKGAETTILGAEGNAEHIDQEKLSLLPGVERVMRVTEPYKKANRKYHPEDTVIELSNGRSVGGNRLAVIAGPCSVESEAQIVGVAQAVKASGAAALRGGAFKPRTSPYAFQGMGNDGIRLLQEAKEATGLPIVTEIMSTDNVEMFEMCVDVIQVGARNMQNFDLLKQLGKTSKPILLKRGLSSTIEEWLDQISGDYSGQNIRDYLSAIDDVAREPWADETRMGCVGASYGGYSVYFLAGHHDKRFKAFIAHCGIFDFDSMYGETEELWFVNNDYGGSYWDKENPTAMRSYANSPHKFADRWDTPILIITGERDYRIPYTQSLEAFTAARVRGIPARLVEFQDEAHQVFKPQNSLVWNREFFGWLDKYVK